MTRCSVLECKNNSTTKNLLGSGVSYHRFPIDPNTKQKWIGATGRVNWVPTKSSCICSEHFAENEILITEKGYRYIDHQVVPSKKIMCYQVAKTTSNSHETTEEVSEPPTKKACTENDPIPHDSDTSIKTEDKINTNHEAYKSPSSTLYSMQRKMTLSSMLRWATSTITKKNLKIKRLQALNRRLKRRIENMEQYINTLEEN